MPVVSAEAVVPVDPATAFAVSQTTGAVRRRWDRFISEQHLMDDANAPAKGVRTFTRQRFGLSMVSRYVSYACLLYTSPSPRDVEESRMPSSA